MEVEFTTDNIELIANRSVFIHAAAVITTFDKEYSNQSVKNQILKNQKDAKTLQKAKDWLEEHNFVINTQGLVDILRS